MTHNPLFTLIKSLLPPPVRAQLRKLLGKARSLLRDDYTRRIQQESARFAADTNINDLPPIFDYWANQYLRPLLETFGFSNPDEFYASYMAKQVPQAGTLHILSIGAGNCDTEVRVGRLLAARGLSNWTITCLDLVPEMLNRGAVDARQSGLGDYFRFVVADFNQWSGDGNRYDVIMANQCLHHVLELERLFDRIPQLLQPGGIFITSDVIGRNGHQRWPEAKAIVDRFWQELPESYRYNRPLRRQENELIDWDCSVEGFEGIRSQDILPLLCERFGFELFIGFGNVIDPFIDRSFGWNFDADAAWDRDFIDRVHAADEAALETGVVTPAHMFAVMTTDRSAAPRLWRGRSPEKSIRRT